MGKCAVLGGLLQWYKFELGQQPTLQLDTSRPKVHPSARCFAGGLEPTRYVFTVLSAPWRARLPATMRSLPERVRVRVCTDGDRGSGWHGCRNAWRRGDRHSSSSVVGVVGLRQVQQCHEHSDYLSQFTELDGPMPESFTGAGDFQIEKIEAMVETGQISRERSDTAAMDTDAAAVSMVAMADPELRDSLDRENIPNPLEGEQTWPTEEELAEVLSHGPTISSVAQHHHHHHAAIHPNTTVMYIHIFSSSSIAQ